MKALVCSSIEILFERDLQELIRKKILPSPKDLTHELQGFDPMIERREFMNSNLFIVLEPKGWDPQKHQQVLSFDGNSQWSEKFNAPIQNP